MTGGKPPILQASGSPPRFHWTPKRNHCANGRQELSLADPRHCGVHVTRGVDAAGAMDAENAPTALSSGDDFKN